MEYIEIAKSHLQYHRKLNDYVKNLKRTRDELNSKIQDIEQQLETELLHVGKVPRKEVENWLKYGKEEIDGAQNVENEVKNGRYLFRAFLAKHVEEKTQEMQNILNKGPNVFEGLVIDGPSVGLPLPTLELIGAKVVRDQIWSCLMQEEVLKIGVWGMGGVGKTTIMKHMYNDLLEGKRFDKVIWVTISKEFNIVKLQDDIASTLKGDLPKEGDKVRRAALLLHMLKKAKKLVLILDDVWDKISLEEVGILEPTSSNGCKVVLTTRKEEVCKFMGCEVIKVNPLPEDEALTLFLNKVGPKILQFPTLESTLRLVVKECAGLPLTIVVVAGTLKGEYDPHIWGNALNELKWRIRKVEGLEAEVIECLKFSFDQLKDEKVKHCFLYCALYPEDFEIRKDELIECWIDEGFIDEIDTIQQMKFKGHAILRKLEDNCLLENVQISRVKMHDAVRDMALSITSMNPRYMIKAGMQLERLPKEEEWTPDVEKVSLMRNSISEIPIDLSPPKCQLLTTLLFKENPLKSIQNSFFANMPCLTVLDLSYTKIECLPNSISELKNLTSLLLFRCGRLKHLPSLSKLQRLKKLDICFSIIEEAPEGIELLVNLRYLDLYVKTLKQVPTGLFPKLSRLQHLRIYSYGEKTSIKAEEVVPLEKLECFFGGFKGMHELKKFVQSMQCKKRLNRYQLHVGPSNFVSNEVKAVSICAYKFGGDGVLLPIDIQHFIVSKCDLLRSLSDISSLKEAVDLRSCVISNCQGIEFVLSFSSFSTSCTPFQNLKELRLQYLPRLSELIKVEGFASRSSLLAPTAIFSHLKEIHIRKCSNIKKLFLHWLLTNLQNLEDIWVGDCEQLVEIFAEDDDEEKGSTNTIKVNLPKLRRLDLFLLPELKSICSKSRVMVCDSLEQISVRNCSKLKRIPPFLSLLGDVQPYAYAPPSLKIHSRREWWESLEWDHPNFKNVLEPHSFALILRDHPYNLTAVKIMRLARASYLNKKRHGVASNASGYVFPFICVSILLYILWSQKNPSIELDSNSVPLEFSRRVAFGKTGYDECIVPFVGQ